MKQPGWHFTLTAGRPITLTRGWYYNEPAVALFVGEDSRPIILAGEAGQELCDLIKLVAGGSK